MVDARYEDASMMVVGKILLIGRWSWSGPPVAGADLAVQSWIG